MAPAPGGCGVEGGGYQPRTWPLWRARKSSLRGHVGQAPRASKERVPTRARAAPFSAHAQSRRLQSADKRHMSGRRASLQSLFSCLWRGLTPRRAAPIPPPAKRAARPGSYVPRRAPQASGAPASLLSLGAYRQESRPAEAGLPADWAERTSVFPLHQPVLARFRGDAGPRRPKPPASCDTAHARPSKLAWPRERKQRGSGTRSSSAACARAPKRPGSSPPSDRPLMGGRLRLAMEAPPGESSAGYRALPLGFCPVFKKGKDCRKADFY